MNSSSGDAVDGHKMGGCLFTSGSGNKLTTPAGSKSSNDTDQPRHVISTPANGNLVAVHDGRNYQLQSGDFPMHRGRSSLSESQIELDQSHQTEEIDTAMDDKKKKCKKMRPIYRKCRSLYGVYPDVNFGPKACLLESKDSTLTIQDPGSQMLTWYKPPLSVLIIKKIRDEAVDGPFVELVSWLTEIKKMSVFIEKYLKDDPKISKKLTSSRVHYDVCTDSDDLSGKVDLIVCLGGDGTLLYASTLFQGSVPPVVAFHLGSLGFLSPFEFPDFKEWMTKVLEGDQVRLILRTRLKCDIIDHQEVDSTGSPQSPVEPRRHIMALNEVVVDRGATPYLCQLDLYIQNKQVTVVQGDGLIISTPTGSTAYAAAAGASMVHPNVPAIIVAPICPHSLSFRPIVVPAGVEIKIRVSPDARDVAWVSFDGRNRRKLEKGDVLVIHTSKFPLPSVCRNDPISDWFESLAGCLHWNVRKSQTALDEKHGRKT